MEFHMFQFAYRRVRRGRTTSVERARRKIR
jgi:hypothetical protein